MEEDRNPEEVMYADMENRLRAMILEVLQPTIQKASLLQSEVENVKGIVSQHTKNINEVQLSQVKAQEQVSMIDHFKEEMGKWDQQRRYHEARVTEDQTFLKQELDGFRYNLEQKESALHHLNRGVDRAVAELNRLQEMQNSLKNLCDERLDDSSKRINSCRAELEVQIHSLELKHHALTDQLWGEETGLAKVTGELHKTNVTVDKLQQEMIQVQKGKAESEQLERLQEDVGQLVREANSSMTSLKQTVGNVVNDVKEHFRTASQTIAAHNAAFISEVRSSYRDELAQAAALRGEVQSFMNSTQTSISNLDNRVKESTVQTESLVKEVRADMEELNRKRKRDKTSVDIEMKHLKKRLGDVFENSDAVLRGMEHLWQVLSMILEGERVQNALELQDSVDRKRIALMGVKDDELSLSRNYGSSPQRPRPEARSAAQERAADKTPRATTAPGGAKPKGGKQNQPIVSVDTRCLSCSGQAPLVMSAFKMACLQYTPSKVEYQAQAYDRHDLLQHRQTLLRRAYDALRSGPAPEQAKEMLDIAPGDTKDIRGGKDALSKYAQVAHVENTTRLPTLRRESLENE
eukprot:gnl/MRDRNA2_/MRDRNA2_44727_c0_seq1.p1 gnl/MRDRNA2_/MRDRNA2_44727_c0~~gnl/MRDRNA2_/MRDRNA2_44727_c0_seq1.p1  ORF type:complete len:578 (-),score=134.15 gnl/MRDRNA2_/MRDRNA2_44727_c0_seq1:41-1774(-)